MGPSGGSVSRSRLAAASVGPGHATFAWPTTSRSGSVDEFLGHCKCKPIQLMLLRQIPRGLSCNRVSVHYVPGGANPPVNNRPSI
jgi:hypothetical protein